LEAKMSIVLAVMAAFLLALNIFVSFGVARSAEYEPSQKVAQLALVWLLPIVGALVAHHILREGHLHGPAAGSPFVESGLGDHSRNDSAADGFSGIEGGGDGSH
jgi:hypothetical protein